ncbi:MAG: helix-turn-helix domain-containing protein [Candidatus Hodarchaeota archaeon]
MTQQEKILEWLKRGYFITQPIAVQEFNCWRLSSVINRLRRKGYNIQTEKIGKSGMAKYTLKMKQGELFT